MFNIRTFLSNIFWPAILVILAVMTILGISYSISRAARTTNSPILESNVINEEQGNTTLAPFEKTSQMDLPSAYSQFPLSQSVNAIEVELLSVQKAGEYLQANLCYQLPSEADWLLGDRAEDVILNDGKNSIPMWGYRMMDLQTSSEGIPTKRCDVINFPITEDQDLSHMTITIYRLVTSIPEVPDCSLAQKKLDLEGIVIQCNDAEGFFGYEVIQKPESLTDIQTSDIVHESFMEIVNGPWNFEVNLDK